MRLRLRRNNSSPKTSIAKKCWSLVVVLFALFLCFGEQSWASSSQKTSTTQKSSATLLEYLTQEKINLSKGINELKESIPPSNENQYQDKKQQITAMLTMTSAKIRSLEGFLDNQNKQHVNLNQKLKHLQQLPIINGQTTIQERVATVELFIANNKTTIALIDEDLDLANEYQVLLSEKIKELELWKANYELEQKLVTIKAEKRVLNKELGTLYQNNIMPLDPKKVGETSAIQLGQEVRLFLNNQRIALIHYQFQDLSIQKNIVTTNIALLKNLNTKTLQSAIDIYKDSIDQYAAIENSLKEMNTNLLNESKIIVDQGLKKSIGTLQATIQQQLKQLGDQKANLYRSLEEYQNQLKKLISSRQSLSEYSISSWPVILKKIMDIPHLFIKYIKLLSMKVYDSYLWLDTFSKCILWGSLAFITLMFFILNRFLKSFSSYKERSRLTGYLYDGVLAVIQRNLLYLCLFANLSIILFITNISFTNYKLLLNLVTVWFTFRVLILIARLALLERISDSSGKDVKLYYRLKWLLLFGGWTTAFMVFSHIYPLSLLLQDIFNRLFMLFLLAVSLVAWKSKDVIPHLIRPMVKSKKRYFKNAVSLLVILVPVTLFTTAVIGLSGFVNLAWTMSRYQAYVLTVLVWYILVRGLIFDALELLSEWMISSLKNGWLWIEVFLKPLDGIIRVALLLTSVFFLFQLFGWHSDSWVITNIEKFAQYSIVNLTGIHITVSSVIEFIILFALFMWASKWTREFAYRWLFRNAKDVGIRNSLAVFTQYSVVLLGSFIALHVLGLDFSGMSMILGGLAVGMGFGLRDFASNIVGGIMLLIERPVREGDIITIGEHEGQVAHIGIRSMRVSSWDNTQVLIPNAETFNKPFTNWTHQDGIVRTVIPIKVSRADDPLMIQQLILDVLAIIPEIVPDPPAQVFLKKIDTALIEFEVRYFINVQDHNRVEIRSKVLFAITAQFNAAGIKAPIEPITVELKEGQGGNFYSKNQSSDE